MFLTLCTILARHYVNINIMYTYYRLKTNLSFVPHAERVYRRPQVVCIGSCNTAERYIFSCMLKHLHIQVTQLLMEHKPGRMKTLFLCVYVTIYVLSRNWTLIPHLVVIYFICCSSPFTQRTVYSTVLMIYLSTCTKSSKLPAVFTLIYSMQEWNVARLSKYMMHCQRYGTWYRNCYVPYQ